MHNYEIKHGKTFNFLSRTISIRANDTSPKIFSLLYKWYFELIRNLMIVGLLLHLGIQSNNNILLGAGAFGVILFSLHFTSQIHSVDFKPFHFLNGWILPRFLNFFFTLVIATAVTFATTGLVLNLAAEIAQSYTFKK